MLNINSPEDISKTFQEALKSIRIKKEEEENRTESSYITEENSIDTEEKVEVQLPAATGKIKYDPPQNSPKANNHIVIAFIGIIILISSVFALTRVSIKMWDRHKRWVAGTLYYWNEQNPETMYSIKLGLLKTETVHLCNGSGSTNTKLSTSEPVDLRIYSETESHSVNYFVTGGIDNIIYIGDIPSKTVKLSHELIFTVKSSTFYYVNPKAIEDKKSGINVLNRYGNTDDKFI